LTFVGDSTTSRGLVTAEPHNNKKVNKNVNVSSLIKLDAGGQRRR
jgi:hypothetical protein